jgi:hypothetical protein
LTNEREWAAWAIARWERFPLEKEPRPLVLVGPPAWPERGFRSGDAKIAFLHGLVAAGQPLPEGLTRILGQQRISAGPPAAEPLVIEGVDLAQAEFLTDRGRRSLSAYRLTGPDIDGALWVLDPVLATQVWAPGAGEPPPGQGTPHRSQSCAVDASDRRLRATFVGGPPEWIRYDDAEVIASTKAVVVLPIATDIGPPGARTMAGFRREVEVELDEPLGGRVVVDLDATPVVVEASVPD